jgi:hypothetical protein
MKEEKLSNAMENFKIEELEPRLEMGKWSAGSGSTYATDPDGNLYTDCRSYPHYHLLKYELTPFIRLSSNCKSCKRCFFETLN